MSSNLSCGSNSVIDLASMDLPVPGSPIIIMWRLCSAAFLITTEPASCPITWSTSRSGIGTSSVVEKSTLLTHSSIGVSLISRLSPDSGLQIVTISSSKSSASGWLSDLSDSATSSPVTSYPHTRSVLAVWQAP